MGPGKPFAPSFPEGPTGPGGPYRRRKKSTDLYFVIGFMVVLWWTPVGTRTHSWSGRPGRSSSTLISSLALKKWSYLDMTVVLFWFVIVCIIVSIYRRSGKTLQTSETSMSLLSSLTRFSSLTLVTTRPLRSLVAT